MTSRRIFPLVGVLCIASFVHAQSPRDKEKPLVYNDTTEPTDREAKAALAGKFRFTDVKQKDGFAPAGPKGLVPSTFRFHDPRSMRDYAIPGKILYAFIITPDGHVTEPRVLHSTDERVSKYIIEEVSYDRYFPARFHGLPVYSLHTGHWTFGGQAYPDGSSKGDGLGAYHGRDR